MDEVEDSRTPTEIVEDLRASLSRMRERSLFLKFHKDAEAYDKFVLALEQADFYLERFEIPQVIVEIDVAAEVFKK